MDFSRVRIAALAVVCVAAGAAGGVGDGKKGIGLIELEHTPLEQPSPLSWLFGSEQMPTIRDVLGRLHEVEQNQDMAGVVVRLRGAELSATQVEEIGRVMDQVRSKGKKVHLFADDYSTTELMLGAHADEVIMQSGGEVMLPGLHMQEMYLADTLEWIGVKPDFVQVGAYKGASEPMARNGPSPEWDQNINGLLDSMYANVRDSIKKGRGLNDEQLDAAMKDAWMANAATAEKCKLIDAAVDLPALSDHLEKSYGSSLDWTTMLGAEDGGLAVDANNPMGLISQLLQEPDTTPGRETIAVVHIDGPITDGDSSSGGFMGEASVGSWTIRRALSEIEDEDLIKGVIVRIDSPGGSAVASEVIWQGIKRVAEKKPVWVSVGSMAASGGYYVAVSGSKIYVNPSSIVGSIGVVGGKLAMAGLYDKVKLRVVERTRGPMGDMLSTTTPWTEAERALVRAKMTETYDLFTRRVTAGRPGIDLSKTAEGRLFTGKAAVEMKMADKVGGLEDAITDLAAHLKLNDGDYDVMDYPGAKSFGDMVGEFFGAYMAAPRVQAGRSQGQAFAAGMLEEVVGPEAWPRVRDSMAGLLQMRKEPVLLISPRVIVVR